MSRDFTVQPDNMKINVKGKFRFVATSPDSSKPATSMPPREDSRILDDKEKIE